MELAQLKSVITIENETDCQDKENDLAQQLKATCDKNGKETDVRKSALLLHKLGKEYWNRSHGMLSLIRSAALFNAALCREPYNVEEIKDDLNKLCKHILLKANANVLNANLIGKSEEIKQTICEWRKEIKHSLFSLKNVSDNTLSFETDKINSVRQMQKAIAEKYVQIMADSAAYCESVMGEAPFGFAIAGMGSLAKSEITPFSDFEHIILLSNEAQSSLEDYKQKLNYYRWFSIIFHTIVINLQESILPSFAISSLNNKSSNLGDWFYDDFTTRGISFDGMMVHACKFPLGRQETTKDKPWKTELIKPVNEMLNYLGSEENLKNGYRLSDVLTKTCFVYKNKDIFDEFQQGVQQKLERDLEDGTAHENIKNELSEDLAKFAIRSSISKLKKEDKLNVKRVIYRSSTLFVSALGKLNKICACSSFDIIEELGNRNIISKYAEHMLMYAIALACEIRLKWYFKNKKQCDEIKENAAREILNMIGKTSTIKYFQIAYALQCHVAKHIKLKKKYFYTNLVLLSMSIGQCFYEYDFLAQSQNLTVSDERLYSFDECLQAMQLPENLESENTYYSNNKLQTIQEFAIALFRSKLYDDALECFELVLELNQQRQDGSIAKIAAVAKNYFLMGECVRKLGKRKVALQFFQKCINLQKEKLPDSADTQHWIGRCLLQMEENYEATQYFEKSLRFIKQKYSDANIDNNEVAVGNYWLGVGYMKTNWVYPAKKYLKKSLQIKLRISTDVSDSEFADILFWYGKCIYYSLSFSRSRYIYATRCFQRSLEIRKLASLNDSLDEDVAEVLYWIGMSLTKTEQFGLAIDRFVEALKIREKISFNVLTDESIAKADELIAQTQVRLSLCLLKVQKANEAIIYLENVMEVTKRYPDVICCSDLFEIETQAIYHCCVMLKQPEKAITYFKQLLEAEKRMSSDCAKKKAIWLTEDYICKCYLDMKKFDEAAQYFSDYTLFFSKQLAMRLADCYRRRCRSNETLTSIHLWLELLTFCFMTFLILVVLMVPANLDEKMHNNAVTTNVRTQTVAYKTAEISTSAILNNTF